ncbi:MAG: outer membrane beta-barrel protein [Alphaproteobacteria bacterium]
MTRLAPIAVTAGLLLAPLSALAQDAGGPSGFYVGIYGGVSFFGDQDIDTDITVNGLAIESDTQVEYDPGYRVGGFVGYQVNTNIRLQLDVSYSQADATNTVDVAGTDVDTDQETEILSGTAGLFFDLWPIGNFVPYIGGGLGVAQVKGKVDDTGGVGDDKQTVLTAFGEAGLPFFLTPEFSIVPSARFSWYNTKEKTENDEVVVGVNVVDLEVGSIGESLYETQLLLSARYSF